MAFDENLARSLISAPKNFVPGQWVNISSYLQLESSFSAHHTSIDRLEIKIHIGASSEERASFALLMRELGARQRWRIYGLDWNPATRHPNPFNPRSPYSLRIFMPGESHEHHFETRLTDDNPDQFATPIDQDLPTYDSALSRFCNTANIIRPPDLPEPPAQRSLV